MKSYTMHFLLRDGSDYKDLAPVFRRILTEFLKAAEQVPEEEDVMEMYVKLNMIDLEKNRKPEGYNRKGKLRLVFPMDSKEFYVRAFSKATDIETVSESIAEILDGAGISFEEVPDLDMMFESPKKSR